MCLYVDFDKTIDDNKTYTFYKVYSKVTKTKRTPLGLKCIYRGSAPRSVNLVAKAGKNRQLPENGQDAYDRYAVESEHNFDKDGNPYAEIKEGIHAYTSLTIARVMYYKSFEKIVKVKVKGENIIAFGQGDVAFTRGKIVGEIK